MQGQAEFLYFPSVAKTTCKKQVKMQSSDNKEVDIDRREKKKKKKEWVKSLLFPVMCLTQSTRVKGAVSVLFCSFFSSGLKAVH